MPEASERLKEIDEGEIERIWQIAAISKGNISAEAEEKITEATGGEVDRNLIRHAFRVGMILTRLTDRLSREDRICVSGAIAEDIDKILQTNESPELLLEELVEYAAAICDKAFRQGYYTALEDEAK